MGVEAGPRAWEVLRRRPDYRAAWRAAAAAPSFEPAPFPVRVQSAADRAAARWRLLAWQDPHGDGPASPFWTDGPMLDGRFSRRAAPILPLLSEAGARLEGLRLAGGGLVLKIERGRSAVQLRIAGRRRVPAASGLTVCLDVDLDLAVRIGRARDLWGVYGCPVPPRGRVRGARTASC